MSLTEWLHRADSHGATSKALVCGERSYSYSELKEVITRVAAAFVEMKLPKGARICILSQNSDRAIISFWAAIWAGYIPNLMNTRWSVRELELSLADCEASLLLVDDSFIESGEALEKACGFLDRLIFIGERKDASSGTLSYEQLITASPCDDRSGTASDDVLLNYTGGTTGKGKGVVHTHSSISSALNICFAENFYDHRKTLGLVVPLFHISGILCMAATLRSQGCLVVVPAFEPSRVLRLISEFNVETMMMVPTMCRMLVSSEDFNKHDLSSLTSILYGGSPIDKSLLHELFNALPNAEFFQVYGQTEGAPISFLHPETHRARGDEERLGSAGNVAHGVSVSVRDSNGKELAEGEVGEVCFKGEHVMNRYWNQPETTAQTINDGWCHSGDVGYMDSGYLYIVDRLKDMIISGGENVYTTEVENVLAACPGVSECAVIGVEDETWGERVHAYVVLGTSNQHDLDVIQRHCRQSLAGYKVPRSFSILDALPLTAVGKIDKVALRRMAL
ncbi:class I adenylate-forming enzyme family protein [Pseudoteredinibacter isoporae]|uniref:Acyl-CoA synthetase (AMP-forming)/AMP-acid ligase II n=1 Tax=Pseudoteredinibacter isoporae TaxID=570281 RepID=A0A7X0JRV2_9GAMM|nr:AMP-binding protein [Pseudoteredinibacter isoporae]MBB6521017.1 acyl-CoA synthetase (AMP-forming)/AMP-acid ligase II [Pseudoteredinibacter isoporae]NHO86582.1 long-chain fatty acid--CoA ligase [Pseudoteredinibacter isoporae]NIB24966.1 long-chain fatty acid--CoA ligase [Pseudoteredinibacter isoporae]